MNEKPSVKQPQSEIKTFCDERDWQQFHHPKDLVMGMSIEANELLDIFRFKKEEEQSQIIQDKKEAIANELSDVFFYVLRFAQLYDIDLIEAFKHKMQINAKHYPVDKAHGNNKKYTDI